ncbi:hypothetical protein B0H13DRAFT_2442243, partial [Mycena leptocephala]
MDTSKDSYCTKLPTELWVRCWSRSSSSDLRHLVLVCRYFRDLCQPLLFCHQSCRTPDPADVDRTNWMSTTRDLHRSTIRLRKLLASAHVSSVRVWDFGGHFDHAALIETYANVLNIRLVDETYLKLTRLFASTLGVYQNLRILHLRQFTVDTQLRETLAGLVRLEKVELTACHILSRTGTLLHLQEFKLGQWWTEVDHENIEQPLHIISPETLRSISLGGHRNSGAMLSAFTEEPATFNNLVTLSIELWDSFIAPFVTFLEGCPQLMHLEIAKSVLSSHPQGHLASAAIPRLRSFKGPRLLAAFFMSNRPVSTVELGGGSGFADDHKSTEKDILGDLAHIAHGCPGVQSLSL